MPTAWCGIDLTDTHLTGEIPIEITLISNSLQRLILNDNPGLGGVVPHFLGDMASLGK